MHEQIDTYLHQCFMVGIYEPYVEVCRRLAELSPCAGENQKSLLLNSGAEAVENAVKIARAATGRPGVVVFENAFHGRTLLTMTMTHKEIYKRGFGPFAPEVYRAPGPYPYRGVSSNDSIDAVAALLDQHEIACVVLEPVQGEGGFIELPERLPASARRPLPRPRCSLRERRGAVRASAAPAPSGRSSTTRSSPTCSSPASRSAAGCPWPRSPAGPK